MVMKKNSADPVHCWVVWMKAFQAAEPKMAEDARRGSNDASGEAIDVALDDGQGDSAIAVGRARELEHWLRATEARLSHGS